MKRHIVFFETESAPLAATQANASVKELWMRLAASDKTLEIETIPVSKSTGEILPHLPRILRAHRLVFPSLEPVLADVFGFLRRELGIKTPALFYLHGHASTGPSYFLPIERDLLRHDEFLVSSEAEKKTLGLSFQRPRTVLIPFAVGSPRRRRRPMKRAACRRFVYIGRISEQKNLHTLLEAFALLERREPNVNFELRVYGLEDRLGAPEFGVKSRGYLRSLKSLERRLGLRGVMWMGFREQAELNRTVLRRRHVFVSPSLHIGENFGLAAVRSLLRGNPAVLSDWGGHRDHKRAFGSSVQTVPVRENLSGPYVPLKELSEAMEYASRYRGSAAAIDLKKTAVTGLRKSVGRKWNTSPLQTTPLYKKLRRRVLGRETLFRGYRDPSAKPLLRAMGMRVSS